MKSRAPTVTRTVDTQLKLLDAAEALFALKGIADAQTREITERAGQRNASALHYHFGSREGLLRAVMMRRAVEIASAMYEILDPMRSASRPTVANVVRGLVLPLGNLLEHEGGRCYLLALEQCMVQWQSVLHAEQDSKVFNAELLLWQRFRQCLPWLPEHTLKWRLNFIRHALSGALAARARGLMAGEQYAEGHAGFLEDLVEMLAAAIGAPVPLAV